MKTGRWVLVLAMILSILIGELYYLKTLPGSFVRVYYTSDKKEFNKPPSQEMTVTVDRYVFDYRIPHSTRRDKLREVKALIHADKMESIENAVTIAKWVREKLKFGTPDYSDGRYLVEETLGAKGSNDFSVLCDSYSRLFVIACQSMSILSRIVELEGHIVPEVFIEEQGRWIMIDPTNGYYLTKDGAPLSVVAIINCYRKDIPMTPVIFAEGKGDDCLYKANDESTLKNVYLNGFTVVSDHSIDRKKIQDTIVNTLQLPIAKIQFVDENTTLIGYKEKTLRYVIVITVFVFLIVLIITMSRSHRYFKS